MTGGGVDSLSLLEKISRKEDVSGFAQEKSPSVSSTIASDVTFLNLLLQSTSADGPLFCEIHRRQRRL